MRKSLPLLLLLLVACGGSNQSNDEVWLPNYSTPSDAFAVYQRAITLNNIDLAVGLVAPDEREVYEEFVRKQFAEAAKTDRTWWVEPVPDTAKTDDQLAVMRVKYIPQDKDGNTKPLIDKNGNTVAIQEAWLVFKKVADGTWRHSPVKSREMNLREQQQPPPGTGG